MPTRTTVSSSMLDSLSLQIYNFWLQSTPKCSKQLSRSTMPSSTPAWRVDTVDAMDVSCSCRPVGFKCFFLGIHHPLLEFLLPKSSDLSQAHLRQQAEQGPSGQGCSHLFGANCHVLQQFHMSIVRMQNIGAYYPSCPWDVQQQGQHW